MKRTLRNTVEFHWKFKLTAVLLSVVFLLSAAIGTSLSYIVTKTPTICNSFVSGFNPAGDLVIRKSVEHPFDSNYVIPDHIAFDFEVDLGEKNGGKTFGEWTTDEHGVLTVSVKPDSFAVVSNIPAGTEAVITELPGGVGFHAKNDVTKQTVTIERGRNCTVEFVNTYTPQEVQSVGLTLTGTKKLTGRDWQKGDSFTFQLEMYKQGSWSSLGTDTVTYSVSESGEAEADFNRFDFTQMLQNVTFDHAGVYSFRVRELEGSAGGISYDPTESYFEVLVGDADMDGYLEIQNAASESANTQIVKGADTAGYAIEMVFENSYAPTGSAEAFVNIHKTLTDKSGQNKSPAGFAFGLYDEDGNLIQTSETTTVSGETKIRLVCDPSDAGKTTAYVIREIHGGQTIDGVTYDEKEIHIQVSVVDNLDGTVSAFVYDAAQTADSQVIPDQASNVYQAEFTNVYKPENAHMTLSGVKSLIGREMKAGEFSFSLYKTEADFEVKDGAEPVSCVSNRDKTGAFSFEKQSFDLAGTYYYVVKENASDFPDGVQYDDTEYFVTVRVTDEGGKLLADLDISDDKGKAGEISFCNVYTPKCARLTLNGEKTLKNGTLGEGMFTFLLCESDENYTLGGEKIDCVTNQADGSFGFDMVYEAAGTYYYVISEDKSDKLERVTYDDTVYGIKVTVLDDGEGQLKVDLVSIETKGTKAEKISFENTYTPASGGIDTGHQGNPSAGSTGSGSGKTDQTGSQQTGGSQKTGDDNQLLGYIVLMIVSLLIIILLLLFIRKKKMKSK